MTKRQRKPSRSYLEDHPAHVSAIGMIAIEAVDLELDLAELFSYMLMIPPRVGRAIMLTPNSSQARLDILKHAGEAVFAPHPRARPDSELERQKADALKKLLVVIGKCQTAMNSRHRAVHDEWDISQADKSIQRRSVNGKLVRAAVSVPIKELDDQLRSIRETIDAIYELAQEFRREKPLMVNLRNSSANSRGSAK